MARNFGNFSSAEVSHSTYWYLDGKRIFRMGTQNDKDNDRLRGAKMTQLLEVLTTDPRARGSSPWHDQTLTQSEESRQLSVIPGI